MPGTFNQVIIMVIAAPKASRFFYRPFDTYKQELNASQVSGDDL